MHGVSDWNTNHVPCPVPYSVTCRVYYECPTCKSGTALEFRNIHSIDWCVTTSYILRDVVQSVFGSKYQQRLEETQSERVRWDHKLFSIGQTIKMEVQREDRRKRDIREWEENKFLYRITKGFQCRMQDIRGLKWWNPVVECISWFVVIGSSSMIVAALYEAVMVFCEYLVYGVVTELTAWLLMMAGTLSWGLNWLGRTLYSDALSVYSPNQYLQYNHSNFPYSNIGNHSNSCQPDLYGQLFGDWSSMELRQFITMHELDYLESDCIMHEQQSCFDHYWIFERN